MVSVGQAHRHGDVAHTEVELTAELPFQPELFQGHFAAALQFLFPVAAFLILLLVAAARAAVFKLNLGVELPAAAEVVAQAQRDVGQVHPSVRRVVAVLRRVLVAVNVVRVKIAAVHRFAVAAHLQAVSRLRFLPRGGAAMSRLSHRRVRTAAGGMPVGQAVRSFAHRRLRLAGHCAAKHQAAQRVQQIVRHFAKFFVTDYGCKITGAASRPK